MNLTKYRNRHINYVNDDFIRIHMETDDIQLLSNDKLNEINIYYPNQAQIDHLPSILNNTITAINIWGGNYNNCKSFEKLKSIEYISIHDNSKLNSLWQIERNVNLKGLGLIDCNKIQSINFVEVLTNLKELHIAGSIWKKQNIKTLKPISNLKKLTYLSLTQLNIEDADHNPLFNLQSVEELVLSENIFTTDQFAELAVFMTGTNCRCFKGYTEFKEIYSDPTNCKDNKVQIVGSRKPELDPKTQSKRIEKYILEFNELKKKIQQTHNK